MDPHPSGQHHIPVNRSLPVLPSSGKVEQLRQEVVTARAQEPPATRPAPESSEATGPARSIQQKLLEGKIIEVLRQVYDPEIPVNIYDLGLIYDVAISPDHHVEVKMTLTTPHCPVAESMPGEVELRVGAVPGVGDCEVELVWDPPWDPQKMSDEAKLELGML